MHTCPRCNGTLSRRPVLSHTDDETKICAACATDETLQTLRGELSPQTDWPIER